MSLERMRGMTTTTEMRELGAAYAKINDTYHRKMLGYLGSFAPMEDMDLFWKMVEMLQKCIRQAWQGDTKRACDEFVRAACFNNYPREGTYDHVAVALQNWETVASFLARYEILKNRLYKVLFDFKGMDRYGDDGFGDLRDAMPLAGRKVVDAIFNGDVANYKQLEAAIPEDWKKFCLHGENYIHMHIEEALEEYYFRIVRVREERDE